MIVAAGYPPGQRCPSEPQRAHRPTGALGCLPMCLPPVLPLGSPYVLQRRTVEDLVTEAWRPSEVSWNADDSLSSPHAAGSDNGWDSPFDAASVNGREPSAMMPGSRRHNDLIPWILLLALPHYAAVLLRPRAHLQNKGAHLCRGCGHTSRTKVPIQTCRLDPDFPRISLCQTEAAGTPPERRYPSLHEAAGTSPQGAHL